MFFLQQKVSVKIGFVILALLLVNGCASKGKQPEFVEIPQTRQAGHDDLNNDELAALHATGHIDGNIPDDGLADVAIQYKYYLRKGRGVMCALSRRSEPYMGYVRQVFKKRGMPEELANLAIVESGFQPTAVSKSGAAGAWQFMEGTGRKYGLAQDAWQDERLDPYRATEAAADYLQKLHNDFGDWPTAIAAYNAGEGKMSRAMLGTGGKNFFEVKAMNHMLDEKARLREETQQYVPRFLAMTKIMRNLPRLGFEPVDLDKCLELKRIAVTPGTDLAAMSRACNLSWEEFKSYNQHHKRHISHPGKSSFVYVPPHAEKLATQFLSSSDSGKYAGWTLARVGSAKDSLEKISRRGKVPLEYLRAANPGLGKLSAGQVILVPAGLDMSAKAAATLDGGVAKAASVAPKSQAGGICHILQPSETLFAVSRKYNIGVAELQAFNGIDDPSKLKKGHVLRIPGKAAPQAGKSSGSIGKKKPRYIVKDKDTLWRIATLHKISVAELKRWNNIDENSLRAGTALIVAEE